MQFTSSKRRYKNHSVHFDFGNNWLDFSKHALTPDRVEKAKADFNALFKGIDFKGKTFLDIGFGQGLGLMTAAEMGAICMGNDINPKCRDALFLNAKFFPGVNVRHISIIIGSILNQNVLEQIKQESGTGQGFDIVHAWGSLHHTGDMWTAVDNTSRMVLPGGFLLVSIYNRHWTSIVWKAIKLLYNRGPGPLKRSMTRFFRILQFFGAWITMAERPTYRGRGMDYEYDLIDWLGGYPYEYASDKEVNDFLKPREFFLEKITRQKGWTGAIEYLFRRRPA